MTNSFSGGFQVFDQPVDTYVEAPREFSDSGALQLAEILQQVNPNLQKFIGKKVEKNRETERLVGKVNYLSENNAAYKTIAKGLKDKLGNRYGRIIQGNSVFVKQGIQEGKAENIGGGLLQKMKNNYNNHSFEGGERLIDVDVQSDEWQGWFQNALGTEIGEINDLDADVFENKLMPKITALSESIYEYDLEQKAEANLQQNRSLIAPRIKNALPSFEKALIYSNSIDLEDIDKYKLNLEEGINSLNTLTDSFTKNGYSGKDLKTLNNDLLDNVMASVTLFINNNPTDPNAAEKAKDLLELFGEHVSLGEGRKLNQHPDWLEKSGALRTDANAIISNQFTVDEKLKSQVKQRSIDKEYLTLLKIDDYTERQTTFKSLYNKYPKYKTYIDNQARSDNFVTEQKINDFRFDMSLNLFKNDQEMITEFMSIEKSSLTDDDEIVKKLSDTKLLLTSANTIKDLVTKGIDKNMDDIQKILKPDAASYNYESQAILAGFEIELTERIPSIIDKVGKMIGNRDELRKDSTQLKIVVADEITRLLNLEKLKMLMAIPNATGLTGLKTNLIVTDDRAKKLGLKDEFGEFVDNPYQDYLDANFINAGNKVKKNKGGNQNIPRPQVNNAENNTNEDFIPTEKMKTNAVLPDQTR